MIVCKGLNDLKITTQSEKLNAESPCRDGVRMQATAPKLYDNEGNASMLLDIEQRLALMETRLG